MLAVTTCVRDGEAPPQVPQGGAGTQPRLPGHRVAMELSLPPAGAHRLQTEDVAVS